MNFDSMSEKKRAGMTTSGMSCINFPNQPGKNNMGTNATMLVNMAKVTGMATRVVTSMEALSGDFALDPRV